MTDKAKTYKGQPRPKVKLVGTDGNAFALLGRVQSKLKAAGCSKQHIQEFTKQATAGDYDNLLLTCCTFARVK